MDIPSLNYYAKLRILVAYVSALSKPPLRENDMAFKDEYLLLCGEFHIRDGMNDVVYLLGRIQVSIQADEYSCP